MKIGRALLSLFIVFLGAFTFVSHTAVASAFSHPETNHKTSTSNCVSSCIGIPSDKTRAQFDDEKDDEPTPPPYYLQFDSTQTEWFAQKQLNFRSHDKPEKVPKYRACCVIRR